MQICKKTLTICLILICLWPVIPVSKVRASSTETQIEISDTIIDLSSQKVLITEQYEFSLSSSQSDLRFEFPLLDNQSTGVLLEVMLSDNQNENEYMFIAEKITAENKENAGTFSYRTSLSETGDMLIVDVYFDFLANHDYLLIFNFDQSALLKISEENAFLKYPVAIPDFFKTTDTYNVYYHLSREILPEEYRFQTVSETWFADQSNEYNNLVFSSNNFRFQADQFIYISLPQDLFSDLAINRPDLTFDNFFPNPGSIRINQKSFWDFLSEPWLLGVVLAVSIISVLIIFVVFELEGYLLVKSPRLGRSLFAINAAHAAHLVKPDAQGSLILAGLLQLVQKNEIDLNRSTFYWNYPEREIFSNFNSSEVFLLQWLFEDSTKTQKYPVTSAEKIYVQTGSGKHAADFLLNFKQYVLLLEDDLAKAGYISRKNKRRGHRGYIVISVLILLAFLLIFTAGKSWWSLILLLPYLFSLFRIFKARYLTLEGREKLKQFKSLKIALQSPKDFFDQQSKWIDRRDLAPLILPYAVSLNLVETYLHQLNNDNPARLGVLDLLKVQVNYSNLSKDILDEVWLFAKTDILRMYYLFVASRISAEISTQQQLIEDNRIKTGSEI
ncbi:MAG TPA: DUF2207 domain-containing protein [Clostridiaceae bacterium]|nr:DUF2207 domain-containing protein [Clostridiaceae bacterium]